MKKILLASLFVLGFANSARAQVTVQDACAVASGPFVVTSGAPFNILWVLPPTQDASATDTTQVPLRVDGFYLQMDGLAKADIAATRGTPCPAGNANVGKIPFLFKTLSGVAKGSHQASISGWNFVLDSSGNPTTQRAEGTATAIPFAAADPVAVGPPPAPTNGSIKR